MNVAKKVMEYILNFIKGRFGDLLAGFVFWLPIGVIVLIVSYIYGNLEDLGATFLHSSSFIDRTNIEEHGNRRFSFKSTNCRAVF